MLSHLLFQEIFKSIKDFTKFFDDLSYNLDNIPKENDIKKIDIEINSIKTETKGFSIELFDFPPNKYYNYCPKDKFYKDDEVILTFCFVLRETINLLFNFLK